MQIQFGGSDHQECKRKDELCNDRKRRGKGLHRAEESPVNYSWSA